MAEPGPFPKQEFDPSKAGPLDGVRVLDLSRVVVGNMLTLQLADFGADVIKIEDPAKGDPLRSWGNDGVETTWKEYSRNKRSVGLNLRDERARQLLLRLVSTAHVLIENFRPGRLEEMGLSPDTLHKQNPGLVIVRISGFGQTGPYRERPGFGTLIEALSGFAARNGFADREPVLPPLALADMVSGLTGAFATMVALREVEAKGGKGQVIDLALLDAMHAIMGPESMILQLTDTVKERSGNASSTAAPRDVYRTKDGSYIALSASIQTMAERVFRAIGREDVIDDPRYRTNQDRVRHKDEVNGLVAEWVAERTRDDVMKIFEREEITASPIYDPRDMTRDPHFIDRGVIVELPDDDIGSAPMHNIVPRLSETPGGFRRPAPGIGADTDDLLEEIGVDQTERAALRSAGIIGGGSERK
ncbi:MAG: CoA transferase [Hyphomicrobiaceae bacterium]|nr:CoA transferase [Hyphomicrobiaceae bacterium]